MYDVYCVCSQTKLTYIFICCFVFTKPIVILIPSPCKCVVQYILTIFSFCIILWRWDGIIIWNRLLTWPHKEQWHQQMWQIRFTIINLLMKMDQIVHNYKCVIYVRGWACVCFFCFCFCFVLFFSGGGGGHYYVHIYLQCMKPASTRQLHFYVPFGNIIEDCLFL